jgi:hypothetical protein
LRASELDHRFNLFFGPPGSDSVSSRRHIALVDDSAAVLSSVAAALPPSEWTVKRAEGDAARWVLATYVDEVGLVITRNTDLLDCTPPSIPVLITVDEDAAEHVPQQEQRPHLAILRRSELPAMLAEVVKSICRSSATLETEGS